MHSFQNCLPSSLSAIAIEGAKGVGKTATASGRVRTVSALDDPRQRQVVAADLDLIARAEPPVLIRDLPAPIRACRSTPAPGASFVLSCVPLPCASERIASASVSLAAMLGGAHLPSAAGPPAGLADCTDEIMRSGLPGIRDLSPRADVRHLHWLKDTLGDRMADLAVLTTGPYAYRRPAGIAVVPLALLGP
jgi:uncharacterized protein